jgi:hypothetical protein
VFEAGQITKLAILTAVAAALAVLPATAGAAFPGKNGRIVFADTYENRQLFTVKRDGSDRRRLTRGPSERGLDANWGPRPK